MNRVLLCTVLYCLLPLCWGEWQGKDCAVDEAKGLTDPNNVYSCKPDETCCTKNLVPACCSAKPTDQVIGEQIALWGTILGIVIFLGFFIWFCRSDQSLLDAETPCLQKFCSCCGFKRRGDDGHLHDSEFGSTTSMQSKSTVLLMNDTEGQEVEDNAANLEAVLEPEDDDEQPILEEEPQGEQEGMEDPPEGPETAGDEDPDAAPEEGGEGEEAPTEDGEGDALGEEGEAPPAEGEE